MANEYVTSSELKATLNMTGETYADADIAVAVEAASRAVDGLCNRRFYPDSDASQVRYYTPQSGSVCSIDDLLTLTSVYTDTSLDGTFSTQLTTNTNFFVEPLNAAADGMPYTRLKINPMSAAYFPDGHRTVKVTGKFGWTAAPPAIKQATTILAAKLLQRSRDAPFGILAAGIDGVASRIPINDPDVRFLVDPFRRIAHW